MYLAQEAIPATLVMAAGGRLVGVRVGDRLRVRVRVGVRVTVRARGLGSG